MQAFVPAVVAALLLALVHLASKKVSNRVRSFHSQLLSFSAGITVSILFLIFFPEIASSALESFGSSVYMIMLAGFAFFHVAEKYFYQHKESLRELRQQIASLHISGFALVRVIEGIALGIAFSSSMLLGASLFIPFLLHGFSSSTSLSYIHERTGYRLSLKMFLPFATLFGVILAVPLGVRPQAYHLVLPFIVGVLLYIVVRDMIPLYGKGKPAWFLAGTVLSTLVIYLSYLLLL